MDKFDEQVHLLESLANGDFRIERLAPTTVSRKEKMMSKRKCTSDDCHNQPEISILFHDGQTGRYCQTCATIIQRNKATGVKSAKPMSGADLVAYRVYNMPTPKRQQEEW